MIEWTTYWKSWLQKYISPVSHSDIPFFFWSPGDCFSFCILIARAWIFRKQATCIRRVSSFTLSGSKTFAVQTVPTKFQHTRFLFMQIWIRPKRKKTLSARQRTPAHVITKPVPRCVWRVCFLSSCSVIDMLSTFSTWLRRATQDRSQGEMPCLVGQAH